MAVKESCISNTMQDTLVHSSSGQHLASILLPEARQVLDLPLLDQLATGTSLDSRCPRPDTLAEENCCFCLRAAACLASIRICSWRQSSLQKGVSPLYMKTSLSRASDLVQSAHASCAGMPGSPTASSASKKKEQATDGAMEYYACLAR